MNHQALLSALKENRGDKTYQSRLTRWVERLLPFHFLVEHVPGITVFAYHLSRISSGQAPDPSNQEKIFKKNTESNKICSIQERSNSERSAKL